MVVGRMVRGESAWAVCVCISCTGDGHQLGSSFLGSGRGVGVGRATAEKVCGQMISEIAMQVFIYCKIALHVSDGTSTNHQERIQLYLQHLTLVEPLLLPVAIVKKLENLVPTFSRQRQVAVKVRQVPDVINTVACAPDDW